MGEIANYLKKSIVQEVFQKEPVKFKNVSEIEDCVQGKKKIKMNCESLRRWEKLKSKLALRNLNVTSISNDLRYFINKRNSLAHPPVEFKNKIPILTNMESWVRVNA